MALPNKKVSLNISERVAALAILNDCKGKLDLIAIILEDIKQIPPSAEEWAAAERKEEKIDEERSRITWNDEKGGEKEIELQEGTVDYLRKTIKDKDEKGEITLQDKAFITILSKLG